MEKYEHIGDLVMGISVLLINYFVLLHKYLCFGLV